METEQKRITLSISGTTNTLLEGIQHHLRKTGARYHKSRIMHEALEYFAKGLGMEVDEASGGVEGVQPVEVEESGAELE
jgi:hypothetical protein